ncbi:MAG: four helix bundle protein [Acidobacteria bacterium]|nr:four helix bundle protein [Acidobacteriota bacterium]
MANREQLLECESGREHEAAEPRRFLSIAMGSASELEYHLLSAPDLEAPTKTDYEQLDRDLTAVRRMLASLGRNLMTEDDGTHIHQQPHRTAESALVPVPSGRVKEVQCLHGTSEARRRSREEDENLPVLQQQGNIPERDPGARRSRSGPPAQIGGFLPRRQARALCLWNLRMRADVRAGGTAARTQGEIREDMVVAPADVNSGHGGQVGRPLG